MKFPFQTLHDFEDAVRNFETLQGLDILDATKTSFPQLLSAQKLHLEYGSKAAALAIGDNFTTITLSTTYTTVYPYFSVLAANTDALANQALATVGTSSFQVDLHSTAIQNVTIYWFALGAG